MRSRDRDGQNILTLCVLLAVVALLAGYISTTLIKHMIRDMQQLHDRISRQHEELHRISIAIEHHLGIARANILSILYKSVPLSDREVSTESLGVLNKSILELEEILPTGATSDYHDQLDKIAANFVALHYKALNWRVESGVDDAGNSDDDPLQAVRVQLLRLQDVNDTIVSEQTTLQQRLLDKLGTQQAGTRDRPSLLDQLARTTHYINASIHTNLADIGRIVESMAVASSQAELTAIRARLVEPALASLRRDITGLPGTGAQQAVSISMVDRLRQMILGDAAKPGIGLYSHLLNRLDMREERMQINNDLFLETEIVNGILARITETIHLQKQRLDSAGQRLSADMMKRMYVIQISTAGSFLFIVTFIVIAVRRQVGQLSRLKTEAQLASAAKNRLMTRMNESETRHRTLFETLTGALITVDEQGGIESFNPAAEMMFGYQPGEVIGRNAGCLVPDRYRRRLLSTLVRLGEAGHASVPGRNLQMIALRADGTEFPVTVAVNEMKLQDRRLYSGIIVDITQKVETEARLIEARNRAEASDRAKSEFLATMSHEIRTPMNGILGMVQLLLNTRLDAQQQGYADSIRRAGQSLLSIINDILDLSRIEARRLSLHPAPFDLRDLLDDITRMFSDESRKKAVRFSCRFPPDLPRRWLGDEVRLRQILNNLAANAVKFTHQGEVRLTVTVGSRDSSGVNMLFRMSDSGIGVHADAREKIFESFVQADGTTTRLYGGSGLGLTICKRLVELMGGEIGVHSTPGKGSEFWFRIHLASAGATVPAMPADPDDRNFPILHADILLVEDNDVNQLVARHMLEQLGCRVTIAHNGEQALRLYSSQPFDLILMDCQMPVMDGYQATAVIREREQRNHSRHIPIVALTANAMSDDRNRCLASGMDDYLSKPIIMSSLAAALQRRLRGSDRAPGGAAPPGRTAAAASARQTLNPVILRELGNEGRHELLVSRVIDTYLENASDILAGLGDLAARGDAGELARKAHLLKSGSAQVGAEQLVALCGRIQQAALEGNRDEARALTSAAAAEYRAVMRQLRLLQEEVANTDNAGTAA